MFFSFRRCFGDDKAESIISSHLDDALEES